ncbi:hypothetical protein SRHO_G00334130 [Serrasalmus rhombeus]
MTGDRQYRLDRQVLAVTAFNYFLIQHSGSARPSTATSDTAGCRHSESHEKVLWNKSSAHHMLSYIREGIKLGDDYRVSRRDLLIQLRIISIKVK